MAQYDKIANKYKEAEDAIIKKYVVEPTFMKLVKKVKGKRVVDLACGSGYFTRKLRDLGGSEIFGIDISKKEIDLARGVEKGEENKIKYFVGDISNFDFSYFKRFDVATAIFLLPYASSISELNLMVKNIYLSLDKGGKFINIIPNGFIEQKDKKYEVTAERMENLKNGGKRIIKYYLNGKEACKFFSHYWSKKTYENALREAGFRNILWHDVVVSKEGFEKLGESFWKKFLNSPYIIGLTCEK